MGVITSYAKGGVGYVDARPLLIYKCIFRGTQTKVKGYLALAREASLIRRTFGRWKRLCSEWFKRGSAYSPPTLRRARRALISARRSGMPAKPASRSRGSVRRWAL